MKNFFKWRLDWIKKNPVLSTRIAFIKGVVFTIIFYEFIKNNL